MGKRKRNFRAFPIGGFCLYLFLLTLLTFTALGVIYSKQKSRNLFAQLQSLQTQQDAMHVEWSQLLLEQGTWATDARIETIARKQLAMLLPKPQEVIIVQ